MLMRPELMLWTFLCNKMICHMMLMAFALHKKRIYISYCTIRTIMAELIFKRRINNTQKGYDWICLPHDIACKLHDTIRLIWDKMTSA
jgi:hypothetical protein